MRAQWDEAVSVLGGVRTNAADDLAKRYAEPHRAYHNAAHVEAVLREARRLDSLPDVDWAVLTLAVCAHDVVYDAKPGDDERASAEWARSVLTTAGVAEPYVAKVEELVLATLTHTSSDPLAQILLDADLSILGAQPEVYKAYTTAVRQEYAAVPDDLWRKGRSAVLESLVARETLFHTEQAKANWDAQARTNMTDELATLTRCS